MKSSAGTSTRAVIFAILASAVMVLSAAAVLDTGATPANDTKGRASVLLSDHLAVQAPSSSGLGSSVVPKSTDTPVSSSGTVRDQGALDCILEGMAYVEFEGSQSSGNVYAPGLIWWVTFGGSTEYSLFPGTVAYCVLLGDYAVSAGASDGYTALPEIGGLDVTEPMQYAFGVDVRPPYVIDFNETGLPDGTPWGVTIGPYEFGTFAPLTLGTLSVPDGVYNYSVTPIPGYDAYPSTVSAVVEGANVTANVTFSSAPYTVTFNETGLPSGSDWWVTLDGATGESTDSTIAFAEPNGDFDYTIGSDEGVVLGPSEGVVDVDGANVTIIVTFEPAFSVTFEQSDSSELPFDQSWSVDFNGTTGTAGSGDEPIEFGAINGSYDFSVESIPGYSVQPSVGSVQVDGANVTVNVTFYQTVSMVTFEETGLPGGTDWSVTLAGTPEGSTTSAIVFTEPNGSYPYTVGPIPGWTTSPYSSSVLVSGADVGILVIWKQVTYSVGFTETGLPSGTWWGVTLNGVPASSNQSTVAFRSPNGTYAVEVTPPVGYNATPATGSLKVNGTSQLVDVTMTPWASGGAAIAELYTVYNGRTDLQAAFPDVYGNFTNYTKLVNWAGDMVNRSFNDSANLTLHPFGYFYVLMMVYDDRSDLQSAYPDAFTAFANYTLLVNWAGGVVTGEWTDSANSTLSPYGYYYDLMNVYDGRSDLQLAFPDAFTSFASYTLLVNWAGWVVNDSFPDSATSTLTPFGYYYVLMLVYDGRADLQAAYPSAFTVGVSYQDLLTWAKDVVAGVFWDSAYTTLLPFASSYAALG